MHAPPGFKSFVIPNCFLCAASRPGEVQAGQRKSGRAEQMAGEG